MPKNTIRDILPPEDRPNRRPVVSRTPAASRPIGTIKQSQTTEVEDIDIGHNLPPRPNRVGKTKFLYYGVGALIILVMLSLLFSSLFGGATVTVHPKQESITVSGNFSAMLKNAEKDQLSYDFMTLEALLTKVVPATGREEVEVRASGQITIFNNYNSKQQKLIRNTRFESPTGKIYRIDKSVVVPGKVDGKPGSIEVTVYADEPGESYNVGLKRFTIPGFEGAPQFTGFYAESKTEMTGGFVGERLIVEDSVLEAERASLKESLRSDLLAQVDAQKPEGFVTFPQAVFIDFISEAPQEKGGDLEIREKAVLYNVLFKEKELAQYLARETLGAFEGGSVNFLSTEGLSFATIKPTDGSKLEPWKDNAFNFTMSGTSDIVWVFDEERLKDDLSGRNKEAIHTILSGYPSINEAEVVIRPFWKGSFPVDVEDIKVNIVLTEK